ncbi:MAG: LLM class flavin-dependent oxidoreductase [Dehalococcoidia bacterium]|nr:LLM class flavin-dependent oxidoreductase [Dehalococcoidia bacterium]
MQFHTFHLFHWPRAWSHQQVYAYEMELIQYAEDLGFDGAWIAEHHFRDYGIVPSIMPFASFAAARTRRIKIGAAVVVLPFQHPLRIAEEAALVDVLSNGRLMFGFGRGYQSIEFAGLGVPMAEARARADESLDIITRAWTEERVGASGTHYHFDPVEVLPKPLQKPHPPVWTAAVSPETIAHYAAKGIPFIADPLATFSRLRRAAEEWREQAAKHGHTGEPQLGALRGLIIAETEAEARRMADEAQAYAQDPTVAAGSKEGIPVEKTGEFAAGYYYWRDRYASRNLDLDADFFWQRTLIAGDPARVRAQVELMEQMGYRHILFSLGRAPDVSLAANKRRLKLFAEAVMPHFKTGRA